MSSNLSPTTTFTTINVNAINNGNDEEGANRIAKRREATKTLLFRIVSQSEICAIMNKFY